MSPFFSVKIGRHSLLLLDKARKKSVYYLLIKAKTWRAIIAYHFTANHREPFLPSRERPGVRFAADFHTSAMSEHTDVIAEREQWISDRLLWLQEGGARAADGSPVVPLAPAAKSIKFATETAKRVAKAYEEECKRKAKEEREKKRAATERKRGPSKLIVDGLSRSGRQIHLGPGIVDVVVHSSTNGGSE